MNASLRFKYTEATLGQRRRRACVCVDRSPTIGRGDTATPSRCPATSAALTFVAQGVPKST